MAGKAHVRIRYVVALLDLYSSSRLWVGDAGMSLHEIHFQEHKAI